MSPRKLSISLERLALLTRNFLTLSISLLWLLLQYSKLQNIFLQGVIILTKTKTDHNVTIPKLTIIQDHN